MRLRRGNIISRALLILISKKPVHGYELVSQLNELGMGIPPGVGQMGRIYRYLAEMEEYGFITFEWDTTTTPPRKMYKITPHGTQYLKVVVQSIESDVTFLQRLLDLAKE
jgi:PadR family transcriptional regulator PadR